MNNQNIQNSVSPWLIEKPTALLLFLNGTKIYGKGIGKEGSSIAEICFNTSMTGYQEILTDPSYAGQIIIFTYPHIGNIGANDDDMETLDWKNRNGVRGIIIKADISKPSTYRKTQNFNKWLIERDIIGISDIDTRALTSLIRNNGTINAIITHNKNGQFNIPLLLKKINKWNGFKNIDLVETVTCNNIINWNKKYYSQNIISKNNIKNKCLKYKNIKKHIIVINYGIKINILRCLANLNCKITIVPAKTPAVKILSLNPDGIVLSNGPGDPAITGKYAIPIIKVLLNSNKPIFGICLGHQMLALALGGKTIKMQQGHHGANHPILNIITKKVEITSMNHCFSVNAKSLPKYVKETHISLFDGSNCGIKVINKPIFSVQYHPEGSPGPQDSYYLFNYFYNTL